MKNTKNVLTTLLCSVLFLFSLSLQAFAQGTDTTAPADIENRPVVKEVGDGSVTLQWDVATDNVGVTGYKIYYGKTSLATLTEGNSNASTEYDTFIKVENVNEYTLTGLENGTKYYFALTALDAANNESEYFSPEAEATPKADGSVATNGNANTNATSNGNQNSTVSNSNANTPVLGTGNGNVNTNGNENVNSLASGGNVNTNTNSALPTLKDVSNLTEKIERILSAYTVTLTWKLPSDLTGIISQIVYKSLDGTVFEKLASLAPNINTYKVEGLKGGTYFFKVTTKDDKGNESPGIIKVVNLPATGPALALIGIASFAGAVVVRKKRNK